MVVLFFLFPACLWQASSHNSIRGPLTDANANPLATDTLLDAGRHKFPQLAGKYFSRNETAVMVMTGKAGRCPLRAESCCVLRSGRAFDVFLYLEEWVLSHHYRSPKRTSREKQQQLRVPRAP